MKLHALHQSLPPPLPAPPSRLPTGPQAASLAIPFQTDPVPSVSPPGPRANAAVSRDQGTTRAARSTAKSSVSASEIADALATQGDTPYRRGALVDIQA
jgi:hypothetical protein